MKTWITFIWGNAIRLILKWKLLPFMEHVPNVGCRQKFTLRRSPGALDTWKVEMIFCDKLGRIYIDMYDWKVTKITQFCQRQRSINIWQIWQHLIEELRCFTHRPKKNSYWGTCSTIECQPVPTTALCSNSQTKSYQFLLP